MLKMLKFLPIIICFLLLGKIWWHYKTTPSFITPYPYLLKKQNYDLGSIKSAENADVLVIGDRHGAYLSKFFPDLIKKVSLNTKAPLKIFNWSEQNEGLHRSIAKLRSLNEIPKIIIYLGASEESYEKKFNVKERKVILENFTRYDDDKKLSLILIAPVLSKFIYKKLNKYSILNKNLKNELKYPPHLIQPKIEIGLKIFEYELKDLVETIISHGSTPIFITPPFKLNIKPKQVCKNAQTPTLIKEINHIEKLIKENRTKLAHQKATELLKISIGNSKLYYLMAKIYHKRGQIELAKNEYVKAAAFDCKEWRSSPIHNEIIRKIAENENLRLIDFHTIINDDFSSNTLFFDEIFPQNIYYEKLIEILSKTIRYIYKI